MAWTEFHHTTLVNCAIASMNLPANPSSHETHVFFIHLRYINANLPAERRFRVADLDLRERTETPNLRQATDIIWQERPAMIKLGKMQFGKDYAGTGIYMLVADFVDVVDDENMKRDVTMTMVPFHKGFGFDRTRARARPNLNWRPLFVEAIEEGKRMKFCCGKVEAEEGVCCCGGWTHDGAKRVQ